MRNCKGYVSGQSLHYTLKASWALDICTKLFCSFKSCNDPLGSKNSRTIFSCTQWEAVVFCVKFCRSHNQHHPMKIPTSKTWTLKDNMKESKDRMRFESWQPLCRGQSCVNSRCVSERPTWMHFLDTLWQCDLQYSQGPLQPEKYAHKMKREMWTWWTLCEHSLKYFTASAHFRGFCNQCTNNQSDGVIWWTTGPERHHSSSLKVQGAHFGPQGVIQTNFRLLLDNFS